MKAKIGVAFLVVLLAGCGGSGAGSSLTPLPANPAGNHLDAGAPVVQNTSVYFLGAANIGGSVALYGFPVGSGDESPTAVVYGPPSLNPVGIRSLATDGAGNIYAAYNGLSNTIVEFPAHPNGSPTPLRTIAGSNTELGVINSIAVAPDGTIFASTAPYSASCNFTTTAINVYAPNANGNVAPIRQITNDALFGNMGAVLATDSTDTIYAGIGGASGGIAVFGTQANGNVAPDRLISGSNTQMQRFVESITVSPQGVIAVYTNGGQPNNHSLITEYPVNANGNAAPSNTITTSYSPYAVSFSSSGDLYVSTFTDDSTPKYMLVYPANASGNATPLTTFIPDVGGFDPPGLTGYFAISN